MKRVLSFLLLVGLLITVIPSVTLAASYTTSASVSPTTVRPGDSATVTVTVESASTMKLLVDLEVYSSSQKVSQKYWDNESFLANQQRTFIVSQTVPANMPAANYTIKVGLFSPGWGTLYSWNDNAGQFIVSAGTASTATPVSTARPTNTSVPTARPTNTSVPTARPTNTSVPTTRPTNTSVPTTRPTNTSVPTARPTNTSVPTTGTTNTPIATAVPTNAPVAMTPTVSGSTTPSYPVIAVDTTSSGQAIDQRILGTNVPAWLGPDRLASAALRERVSSLGPTLIRLPGGSWSNAYDWSACETGDASRCYWPWAARPSDFIAFLRATNQQAIWTVSIDGTSLEAAAAVAFFNGSVNDTRTLGIDNRGRDWKTVGYWAQLRAAHGSPQPLHIGLWEVGNEVYGGKASSGGKDCAPWGWEDVWTCDGTEYVNGIGSGATRHEGYVEFRNAMRTVDPTIKVGAVGVSNPADWSNWGNEVIAAAKDNLDFYIVHAYGFNTTPSVDTMLTQPQRDWPQLVGGINAASVAALGHRVPIAITEYNLVAYDSLDSNALMRRAANALFIADTIGQMALQGVAIANQWNLANGTASNGTDYGLVDVQNDTPNPQYFALALWQRFGTTLLPVTSSLAADTTLSVYAGRAADGTVTLMAINKTGKAIATTVQLQGLVGNRQLVRDEVRAATLDATQVTINGVTSPVLKLDDAPPQALGSVGASFDHTFAPNSITLLRLQP